MWRRLPGPLMVRVLTALMLLVAVVALLMLVVFPAVDQRLPFNDVSVN